MVNIFFISIFWKITLNIFWKEITKIYQLHKVPISTIINHKGKVEPFEELEEVTSRAGHNKRIKIIHT